MNHYSQNKWRVIACAMLVVLVVALVISTAALANGHKTPVRPVTPRVPTPIPPTVVPSAPSSVGAGCLTSVSASNSGNNALIYVCPDWITGTPEAISGTIQIFACLVSNSGTGGPTADVVSKFTYNGSNYVVTFTCVLPSQQLGFSGISTLTKVFGGQGPNLPGVILPQTMAYITVLGNVTITKDGTTMAENQPALAMVTNAIHDPLYRLLTEGDPTRREIHLFVPGSMVSGGTAIQGFPNGAFYIYWPTAAINMTNVGGVVTLSDIPGAVTIPATTPATTARGPMTPQPFKINLTNNGIETSSNELSEGLYDITITNSSKRARGIFMTGTDVCCTEFNRFTKVLAPGKSQLFRFYFAKGPVKFRDMFRCERRNKTCALATFGTFTKSIEIR